MSGKYLQLIEAVRRLTDEEAIVVEKDAVTHAIRGMLYKVRPVSVRHSADRKQFVISVNKNPPRAKQTTTQA